MDYIGLTEQQARILDFIKQELRDKKFPPSVREICDAVGLRSPSTVHLHLNTLESKGYIRRHPGQQRALEVIEEIESTSTVTSKEMVDIPIIGKISAGLPMLAEEHVEDYFPVPLGYLHSNKQLFMLRVSGESMIEAGIHDGDLLIVEEASSARNGEIIVALVDDEATVKTFYRELNCIRLQPGNSTMAPIIVDRCDIIGKPIGLFRRF